MNQAQAIAKLKKLIGPKFGYRVDPKAPDAEERERIRGLIALAADEVRIAEAARTAKREALLAGDPEYQRLKAAHEAAKQRREGLPSVHHKRVTVGRVGSVFFSVVADGDNWSEVVEKVLTAPR